MRKQWLGICVAAGLLTACTVEDVQQKTVSVPQPAVCHGPAVEISGADPQYEAPNPSANQDYQHDGRSYKIVHNPAQFTQSGLAAIYDAGPNGNLTASGEAIDSLQLSAAHPTLPIPSYARITNLANGRMLVVRINDRGPFTGDRVISLSRAAADRLNTSNNTRVRIDPIVVAPDGSLSGPGMACTTVAKQTYALPARPDLNGNSATRAQGQPPGNAPQQPGGGFLSAPTTPSNAGSPAIIRNAPVTAPGSIQGSVTAPAPVQESATAPAPDGNIVVQVGAVSDRGRAQLFQQRLSQQFAVPGRVAQNGTMWRIQLGPFADRAQATALQQRLQSEIQLASFITHAN